MSVFSRCPTCGDYVWRNARFPHMCGTAYYIVHADAGYEHPDEVRPTYAASADAAVEKWAERDDAHSADYTIVGGQDAEVSVWTCDDDGEYQPEGRYRVSGETVPSYSADRIGDIEGGEE